MASRASRVASAAAGAAAILVAPHCGALAASPLRPPSVFVAYANVPAGQTQLTNSPQIAAGFNGAPAITFTMDTGSTGIVVSPDNFTPPAGAVPIGPGSKTYTSSGRTLSGDYYMTLVNIGSNAATARVPVLLVDAITCAVDARDCQPTNAPTGVAMFGVGFGQEQAGQPGATPDKNPFLNIIEINGRRATPSAGYEVTAEGVTLGLTPAIVRRFRPVRLTWDRAEHDWSRPPVTVQVAGWTASGTALTDTGVTNMYLQPPLGETVPTIPSGSAVGNCIQYAPCAAPGTVVRIWIGAGGAAYQFKIGPNGLPAPTQVAAPAWVTVVGPSSNQTFVNTTFHFFNKFDYIYDFTDGIVGFRSAGTSASAGSDLLTRR